MAKAAVDLNLEDDELLPGATTDLDLDDEPKSAESKTKAIQHDNDDDEDLDFGDEDAYRRPGELEVIKVEEANTFVRFSILPNPATGKAMIRRAYAHYVQGKGYGICHSTRDKKGVITHQAFCCKAKESEPRYMALVVQYANVARKTGKIDTTKPLEYELKALGLSRVGYKDISLLPPENEDTGYTQHVTTIDITATPKEGAKGLKYSNISNKACWSRNAEMKAAVLTEAAIYMDGKELKRKCGRELSVVDMKAHLGIGGGASDEAHGFDDLD